MLFKHLLIYIRGGGDLATGVAYRVHKAGFPVAVLELAQPMVIRRTVSFAQAVFCGEMVVNGVKARKVENAEQAEIVARSGIVAVMVDPQGKSVDQLKPAILVDARMIKKNPGDLAPDMAPLVIALGPGYSAGEDCHVVVETNRGHDMGRVILQGSAEPDTGIPGQIGTRQADRVLRAPGDGVVKNVAEIGDHVETGQLLTTVNGKPVQAPFDGVLRGLVYDGANVPAGGKIGDVDPRGIQRFCFSISDKALAIGGGVLEAIFSSPKIRPLLYPSSRSDE
ncbi:MAG: EF2563 family selenium-dependent molybdenum hydroxylase system protein [Anaerolineales bacterium]|nr:EF2563 family selenium-dependent molybdenum hydroxylase system protein [Anaerolineales bacterium]